MVVHDDTEIVSGGIVTLLISNDAIADVVYETILREEGNPNIGFGACIDLKYDGIHLTFHNTSPAHIELNLKQII